MESLFLLTSDGVAVLLTSDWVAVLLTSDGVAVLLTSDGVAVLLTSDGFAVLLTSDEVAILLENANFNKKGLNSDNDTVEIFWRLKCIFLPFSSRCKSNSF